MLRRLAARQQALNKLNTNLQAKRNGLLMQREGTIVEHAPGRSVASSPSMESVHQTITNSQDQIRKVGRCRLLMIVLF